MTLEKSIAGGARIDVVSVRGNRAPALHGFPKTVGHPSAKNLNVCLVGG